MVLAMEEDPGGELAPAHDAIEQGKERARAEEHHEIPHSPETRHVDGEGYRGFRISSFALASAITSHVTYLTALNTLHPPSTTQPPSGHRLGAREQITPDTAQAPFIGK